MIETLTRWLTRQTNQAENRQVKCLCCGECCEAFGGHLNASKTDLERWRNQGRDDLLDRVNRLGWIWVEPQSKRLEQSCPFLDRQDGKTAICGIQETKPAMCRDYPTLAHGRRCLRGVFLKVLLPAVGGLAGELEALNSILWH